MDMEIKIESLKTYAEAIEFYNARVKEFGAVKKYTSTEEYRVLFAKMQELIKAEGLTPKRRKRVKVSICLFLGQ